MTISKSFYVKKFYGEEPVATRRIFKKCNMMIYLILLFRIAFQNIYFPTLIEDYIYTPFNLGQYPLSYFSFPTDPRIVVQFYMNETYLYSVYGRSNSTENYCILFKINTKVFDEHCALVNLVVPINPAFSMLTINCAKYSFILLIKYDLNCSDSNKLNQNDNSSNIGEYRLILTFTNFKKSQPLLMSYYKNSTNILISAMVQHETQIGVMNIDFLNFEEKEMNSLFFEWHSLKEKLIEESLEIIDAKFVKNIIFLSMSDGFLYYFDPFNNKINKIIESRSEWDEKLKFETLIVAKSGNRVIHITSFKEGAPTKQGTIEIATYTLIFDVLTVSGNKEAYFEKCGTIRISDIVFVYSHIYENHPFYNPCKLDHYGNLFSCLILGEPYIFDIHDCNSAHPISSFGISSNRLGHVINRFDFLDNGIFFSEMIRKYDTDSKSGIGLIFDIHEELQPTLIASQVVFPTLATAITPAESFILVNHEAEEIYYFTHSGRIFYSKSMNNKFEIQLIYRHDMSFYIADVLRMSNNSYSMSIPHSHNFEHPFGFLTPKMRKLVYLSYYPSLSGTFVASAVSIAAINETDSYPKSIIHIGEDHSLIQCGVNLNEDLIILVYESMVEKYFDVKITLINNMPNYSMGTDFILAQNEINGTWITQNFLTRERTRIWVAPFLEDNIFFLASHDIENISTIITEYGLNPDFTLKTYKQYRIDNCLIVMNINDYLNKISVILCAEKSLPKLTSQFYSIIIVNFSNSWEVLCTHKIDHEFKLIKSNNEDLPNINIPLYDYDSISQRLILSYENRIFSYSVKKCPFVSLYSFKNHHIVSSVGVMTINLSKIKFTISLISYLQRLDALSDCTNGFGLVDQDRNDNWFCVRCSPGKYGLGCQPCTAGFYCQGYSQLQPTAPCPEGYYCLEGTSFGVNKYFDVKSRALFLPNLCPPGSYCPAGTATNLEDDLKHNNPKPCLEGFYCPAGSTKPTQNKCPLNSLSPSRSKRLQDCVCKDGFYGNTETGICISCIPDGNCSKMTETQPNYNKKLYIPVGYWPNVPKNTQELLKCDISLIG